MVRVVTHKRREIESRREAGLAVRQQVTEALVGVLGGAETGKLAHRPQATTMHGSVDTAGVGRLAGMRKLRPRIPAGEVGFRIQTTNPMTRNGREFSLAFGAL